MAADKAIVSISASLLPEEIRTRVSGVTTYNIDDLGNNNKWLYTLTLIGDSSEDLIKGGAPYLGQGVDEEGVTLNNQAVDDVVFLFVKHSGTTNGTESTGATLYINLGDGTPDGNSVGDIVIKPNECFFARIAHTKGQEINAISSTGVIQAQVFAICDDGGV